MVKTYQIFKKKFHLFEKEEIKEFANSHSEIFPHLFNSKNPLFISRAPGRLDLMGGIADYSGAVVCEGTLRCRTIVGVQQNNSPHIHIMTKLNDKMGLKTAGKVSLNELFLKDNKKILPLEQVRSNFQKLKSFSWTAYALGGFYFLLKSGLITQQTSGINMGILSNIPLGCGVSSSASLEVSAFIAIIGALGLNEKFSPMEIAKLCQKVENDIVGAPCGIMDQVTCILGEKRTLIKLECQPHNFLGKISIPESVRFIGINSNVKHSVGGERYKNARIGAFMGHKIIVDSLGNESDPYKGYLCNITPSFYNKRYKQLLPQKMEGLSFLEEYQETFDPLSNQLIETDKKYDVRLPTEHPILENNRVQRFITLLERYSKREKDSLLLEKAGQLMYDSHESYSKRCNLGAPETDLIVKKIEDLGVKQGFYGAKITGGGSGGTVAVFCKNNETVIEKLKKILEDYRSKTNLTPQMFLGSSDGALSVGIGIYFP